MPDYRQKQKEIPSIENGHINRRKLTEKQLTRDVLVELIDKIYVYPDQKIDIYFKFAMNDDSPDVILQKGGVM